MAKQFSMKSEDLVLPKEPIENLQEQINYFKKRITKKAITDSQDVEEQVVAVLEYFDVIGLV